MTIPITTSGNSILNARAKEVDFEIFMVKRSSRSAFGSLYVFPGGKLDPEDSDS